MDDERLKGSGGGIYRKELLYMIVKRITVRQMWTLAIV